MQAKNVLLPVKPMGVGGSSNQHIGWPKTWSANVLRQYISTLGMDPGPRQDTHVQGWIGIMIKGFVPILIPGHANPVSKQESFSPPLWTENVHARAYFFNRMCNGSECPLLKHVGLRGRCVHQISRRLAKSRINCISCLVYSEPPSTNWSKAHGVHDSAAPRRSDDSDPSPRPYRRKLLFRLPDLSLQTAHPTIWSGAHRLNTALNVLDQPFQPGQQSLDFRSLCVDLVYQSPVVLLCHLEFGLQLLGGLLEVWREVSRVQLVRGEGVQPVSSQLCDNCSIGEE